MRKKQNLAILGLTVCLILLLFTQGIFAGSGTYTEGGPDQLTLNVAFEFDVSPAFNPNPDWENAFTRASELLYNSTDGQLQIGTINFYNDCPEIYDRADILIHSGSDGASAHVSGLDKDGRLIIAYDDLHTRDEPAARGHFGIVHELGHYVFGLYDEYKDSAGNPASCISPDSTIASIMDGGTTIQPNNQRTEWALPADQVACQNTAQFEKRGVMDWPWIVQHVLEQYGAILTVPSTYSTAMPAGHQPLTFNYYACKVRAVVCLDRSTSMLNFNQMVMAKESAKLFIDLTETPDELGVSSFSDDASQDYPINVMNEPNKTAAKAVVDSLVAYGQTNIGGGLQVSLDMITGEGGQVSNEVIVLLSDGHHNTGTHPVDVFPALKARGVVVHTIGLGQYVDTVLLSNIAHQTGGTYFYAATAAELPAHFSSIFTRLRNDGLITRLSEDIAAGQTAVHTAYVDSYTEAGGEATFVLSWAGGDLDLSLVRPDGTPVGDSDSDVKLHVKASRSELYRMHNPATGPWTMSVASSSTATSYDLHVNSTARSNVLVLTSLDKADYYTNEPVLIQTTVLAPPSGTLEAKLVAGASVTGVVKVDGTVVSTITLHDDGADVHGDDRPDDGIYSNYFTPVSAGNYVFDITITNQTGTTAPPDEETPGWVPEPVDPFTRKSEANTVVQASTNLPPIADANGPYVGDEGELITLDASGSSDPDGVIILYEWDLDNDGAYDDATGVTAEVVFDASGTYQVGLKVTDDGGASDTDTAAVIVQAPPGNQPPTADANGPYAGDEGEPITLDASGSSDPEGTIILYEWDLDNDGQYDEATGVTPSVTFDNNGSFTVGLRVTDDAGDTATDTATVSVNNLPPAVEADLTSQTVQSGDPIVSVTFTATDVAADLMSASTAWSVDGGPFTDGLPTGLGLTENGCTISGNTNTCTWTLSGTADMAAGEYAIRVTVADDDAGQTDAGIIITVLSTNQPPIADANGPYEGIEGEPIILDASGSSDPDGTITLYEWDLDNDGDYDDAIGITAEVVFYKDGAYQVGLKVTDDGGASDTATAEIVVNNVVTGQGFTTGGGWFYWPGTTDRTNFGYNVKYHKKSQKVKGNLVLIRHLPDGSLYRVKSTTLHSLALGESTDPVFGWASFSGKCTYREPGWPKSKSGYEFLVYVEDRNQAGTGADRFWIEVKDKNGNVVAVMSMDREATDNAVEIQGGNIVVPHKRGGRKK